MRVQALTLFVSLCALASAQYITPADVSGLTNSSQPNGAQTWRTVCFDPSSTSNIYVEGGLRARTSLTFTSDRVISANLQFFLGPSCTTTPTGSISATFVAQGSLPTSSMSLGSYVKFNLTVTSVSLNFQNAVVQTQFNAAFNCNPTLFTNYPITSGCGNFYQPCGSRYVAYKLDSSSGTLQFSSFISQTSLTAGCSDATAVTDFNLIGTFSALSAADLIAPVATVVASTSNSNTQYCNSHDTVTLTITSTKQLQGAPTVALAGNLAAPSAVTTSDYKTFVAVFSLSSGSYTQSDLCQRIVVSNIQDLAGNTGNNVLACANSQSLLFLKYPLTVAYTSYSVGTVTTPSAVDPGSTITFMAQVVNGNYGSSSVLFNLSTGVQRVVPYSSTDSSGVAQYVYTVQVSDPAGPTNFWVTNVLDASGMANTNSTSTQSPTIVAPYPRLYSAALVGSSATGLTAAFYCTSGVGAVGAARITIGVAPNPNAGQNSAYYDIGNPPYQSYDLAHDYTGVTGSGQLFVTSSNVPNIQTFDCPDPSSGVVSQVPISINGFQLSTWYSVAYVTFYKGSSSYSPSVSIAGSVLSTSNPTCFPGSSSVELEGGERLSLSALSVGDRVLSLSVDGHLEYSDVVRIRVHAEQTVFMHLQLKTADSMATLRITPNHLLFKAPSSSSALESAVLARDIKVGDRLLVRSPHTMALEAAEVEFISFVADEAAYSPITMNGRLLVDGVAVSSYGSNGEWMGHISNALHRALYRVAPSTAAAVAMLQSWPVQVAESVAASVWHASFKHIVAAVAPQILS